MQFRKPDNYIGGESKVANVKKPRKKTSNDSNKKKKRPDSYYRIMEALEELLKEKDFNEIKWTDLSAKSGVNTGLIYRYYKDLKSVLFALHDQAVKKHIEKVEFGLRGIEGAFNKIRKFIWIQVHGTYTSPGAGRVQFLEVRAHMSYLKSRAYQTTKQYIGILRNIIQEGIDAGEIRDDIPVNDLLRFVFGVIEQNMMPIIMFQKKGSDSEVDERTETICKLIFPGLKK